MRRTNKLIWLLIVAAGLTMIQVSGCGRQPLKAAEETDLLTKDEIDEITKYVKGVNVADAVGQLLMVGLPADINTIRDKGSADVDRVMSRQVGFVLPQAYTYYDDGRLQPDEYLSKVIEFNNAVQVKATKGPLGLPVLFAADFEGPQITPFRRALIPPPSALSLGTTQDKQTLTTAGGLVGFQLRHAGVQILLGPVLDVYNIKQGNKNGLLDRSFASTPDGVARTASNFANGLKQSGLMLFAKHYPSHGSIETNPHSRKQIPRYEGSNEQRVGELKPFESNKSMIDGVMTSHIEVEAGPGWKMATFSAELLSEVKRKEGMEGKIYITDDLSEMGAISNYMGATGAKFADVAIQAFSAGHDLLMFAHLGQSEKSSSLDRESNRRKFRIDDLESVLDRLTAHIKSNQAYDAQFRRSLEKIIRLKVRTAKSYGYKNPMKMLRKGNKESFFHVQHNGTQAIEQMERDLSEFVKRQNPSGIQDVKADGVREQVVMSALEKSIVVIRDGGLAGLKLSERNHEFKVMFAADAGGINKLKSVFSSSFPKAKYFSIPSEKGGEDFKMVESALASQFPGSDLLIYTVYDESDADLLSRLYVQNRKSFPGKVLIFLHASPAILDLQLIGNVSIIGTFTRHPSAIETDIEILMGRKKPRDLSNLSINVGDNGKYYNVSNTKWVMPADTEKFERVFFGKELESCIPVVEERYFLVPKSPIKVLVTAAGVLISVAVGLFIALYFPVYVRSHTAGGKQVRPVIAPLGSYWVSWSLAIIATVFLLFILMTPKEMLGYIQERKPVIDQIKEMAPAVPSLTK